MNTITGAARAGMATVACATLVAGCGAATQTTARLTAAHSSPAVTPAPAATPTAKRCGPPNGDEPVDPVIAPRKPQPFGRRVVADVDGDGRPDVAQLYRGWHTAYGMFDRIVVRFANGRVVSGADILDFNDPQDPPSNRLLGSADVNSDGRAELVVEPEGNTISSAEIITLIGGRLLTASVCRHDPYDGYYRDPGLPFFAHGNACMPWCTDSTTCMRVGGRPRLVLVDGETHNRYGDLTIHRLYWTATVYRLVGADLVQTATYHGTARSAAALPRAWPFTNDLSCGTAHSSEGS